MIETTGSALFLLVGLVIVVALVFRNAIVALIKLAIGIGTIYVVLKVALYILENTSIT